MCVDDDPDPDEINELDKNNFDHNKDDNDDGRNNITYAKRRNKQWNEMFHRLFRYKRQYNSTSVPRKYATELKLEADNQLGKWVDNQRQSYKRENLYVDRIERLELIGFVWDTFEEQWMAMYDRLVMYKKKHKSTQVPSCYNGDNQLPYLGYWAVNQRVYYRDGKLLKKRVELLNSISFKWEVK